MTIPAKRRHWFYAELSKLVGAGFGVREAAGAMLENKPGAAERSLLEGVLAGLDRGETIAAAFAAAGVGKMEHAIISAGERGGRLAAAFEHLAEYFGLIAGARRDGLMAMVYPLILLHFGLLLAAIPADVITEGMSAGDFAGRLLGLLVATYVILAVGTVLALRLLSLAPRNAALDRAINRLPVLGPARRNLAMTRFTRVFHAGLLAGLTMSDTARMAGEAAHSGEIDAASDRLAEAAKAGDALGPVMVGERAFPKAFAKSYLTAEKSGTLDADLNRWARVFQDDAARGVKALSVTLPKLGYALVVIYVVWRIFSFYSGYFGVLEEIGA